MLQICRSFIIFWTVSSRILREDESNKISTEKVTRETRRRNLAKLCSSFVSIWSRCELEQCRSRLDCDFTIR